MCLIAFGWNPAPSLRLLVVANRDEFHGRPSAPLAVWPDQPDLMAGRDIEAAGTWLGISTRGRMAAVTNVRRPGPMATGLSSRGTLALDFLAGADTPQGYLSSRQAELPRFGPCNLLIADHQQAFYASNQPLPVMQRLDDGLYGLSNAALDTSWPKTTQLKSAVQDWIMQGHGQDTSALFAALANPSTPPDAALPDTGVGLTRERFVAPAFIKGREYGTRCSTVIVVDADGHGSITERRFGRDGIGMGETRIAFQWPDR